MAWLQTKGRPEEPAPRQSAKTAGVPHRGSLGLGRQKSIEEYLPGL